MNQVPLYPGPKSPITSMARTAFALLGACSLLIPIVVLNFIKNQNFRILATIGFVLAFIFYLVLFTEAKHMELVAAAAAYSAVLVVYLGSSIP